MKSCIGCPEIGVENCIACVREDLYGNANGIPQTERAAHEGVRGERLAQPGRLDAEGQRGHDAGVRAPEPADGGQAGGDLPGMRRVALAGGGVRPDEPARAADLEQDSPRNVARERGCRDSLGGSRGAHKRLIIRALVQSAAPWAAGAVAVALAAWLMFTACQQFPAFGQMMVKVADYAAAVLSILVIVVLGLCSILRFE
ncbi:MAG TPA: hypothetical protein DCY07_00285 [Rhodospirillaceae bacterium]|nr:hypothetical protein [Rhodospirillaceae bacterium]